MMGCRFQRRAGMGALFKFGEDRGTSSEDVKVQEAKSKSQAEMTRLKTVAAQQKAMLASSKSSKWAQLAPFFIVGGLVAIGAVAMAIRARRNRK